jgi:hypothetical protein
LSQNNNLEILSCNNNNLTSLNIKNGNNGNITYFDATSNYLTCITADAGYSHSNVDLGVTFSQNCGGTLAVEGINDTLSYTLYPNPISGDYMYLKSSEKIERVIVTAISGVEVLNTTVNDGAIDFRNIEQGIYILQLISGEKIVIEKVIRN